MRDNAGIQIIGFITILFFLLFLYKYFTADVKYEEPVPIRPVVNKVRCPPINTIPQTENAHVDASINMSKNDLQIVGNKFNMYDNESVKTFGFENELQDNHTEHKKFSAELDDLYAEIVQDSQVVMHSASILDEHSEYVKRQKTDLPIANVPAYLLNKNEPLRLSEKPRT